MKRNLLRDVVAACAVGVICQSQAEILVSEGCDTTSDYANVGSGGSALLSSFPKAFTANVGLAGSKWSGYGTQPHTYPTTLPLPTCFESAGIVSKGAACVGMNRGSNATGHRWGYLELEADKLKVADGTTLYFRGLINVDKGGAGMLSKPDSNTIGNGNSFGFGLAPRPSSYGGENGSPMNVANGLGFYYWKNSSGGLVVSVRAVDASGMSSSKRLIDGLAAPTADGVSEDNTIVCYAEVKVGAGTDGKEVIRAGAARVRDYDFTNVTWCEPFESEIISGTAYPTCLHIVGDYCVNGWAVMDEFVVATELSDVIVMAASGSPKVTEASLTGSSGSYTASGVLSAASADDAGVVAHDGSGAGVKFSVGALAFDGETPVPFEKAFAASDLAANRTYEIFTYAENDVALVSNSVGFVYTGALTLTKVRDADEYQCKPGEVTVSRAFADPFPLPVSYTLTSTAEGAASGKTWEAPGSVVIPAGATSATLTLKPMVDAAVDEDITVTLALAPGHYAAGTVPVDLLLKNLVPPEGYNTWVAAADGLASEAVNWSRGVPTASDNILFDGNFSKANCTWDAGTDNGPSPSVASWTQRDGYTGKVAVATLYPEVAGATFTTLTVTGNMTLESGTLTQVANDIQKEEYRLNARIGGNLTVGAGAKIDVTGCGPRGVMSGRAANVHAGDSSTFQKTYGDPKRPYYCGSGNNGAWPSYYKGAGGGAVWLEVAGTATVTGKILSEGSLLNSNMDTFDGTSGNIATSGGSVYLKAAALVGDGTGIISTKSEFGCNSDNQIGSGGRVAVELTGTAYDFDGAAVQLKAHANAKQAGSPGHGTIVVKNPGEANGSLYVLGKHDRTFSYNNCEYTRDQTTAIPKGETWTFDKVVVGDFGMISVGPEATLALPNGWESVHAKNKGTDNLKKFACGIIDRGGTFVVPAKNGKHLFTNGNWTFHPTAGRVLAGDVEIADGASIGAMYLSASKATVLPCDLKVTGNLTVSSTGYMNAIWGGLGGTSDNAKECYSPFLENNVVLGSGHGGQNARAVGNDAYGSFFKPCLPGTPSGHADCRSVGSGVIKLEVTGTLTVDGKIQTNSGWDGQYWNDRPSAPGSIDITAGSLAGTGTIRADGAAGYVGAYPKSGWKAQGPSGGGRVAVRLTDRNAVFSDAWLAQITAKGASATGTLKSDTEDETIRYSSAGSVYLQMAKDGEKRGTVFIRNDGKVENVAYTPVPSVAEADVAADFKNATFSLLEAGKVRFFSDLQLGGLTVATDSKVDLNGRKVVVKRAKLGAASLSTGKHTAASVQLPEFLEDSVGGGILEVTGGGFCLNVR